MESIGLDLHKHESQLCILTEAGEVVEQRIVTSRERFAAAVSCVSKCKTATLFADGGATASLPHGGGEPSGHWAGRRSAGTLLARPRASRQSLAVPGII